MRAGALAAALIVAVAGCAAGGEGRQGAGEHTDDAVTTARVKTAIATEAGAATAAAVKVETQGGVVRLDGFVDSVDQASRAATAAEKVRGVRSVRNDIRIRK